MDRTRCIAAAGVVVGFLGLVEREQPAFAPAPAAAAERHTMQRVGSADKLQAAATAATAGTPDSWGHSSVAGAALALGAVGIGMRRAARRHAGSRARTQVCADASGLVGGGPVVVYTKALMDAADKQDEQVAAAQDMMMLKAKFTDEEFLDELQFVVNETSFKEMDRAQGLIKLLEFQSSVVPKFIVFLAKKKRLMALKLIAQEFVTELYTIQSVAPVKLRCAQRLTEEQIDGVKAKMMEKTGASDIKLIVEVDASLLGGFVVEWGFPDPEDLGTPTDGIDLSLRAVLEKAALNEGVLATV